jgi:hypothetical protein
MGGGSVSRFAYCQGAFMSFVVLLIIMLFCRGRGGLVVKALSYKPEGRGFQTR